MFFNKLFHRKLFHTKSLFAKVLLSFSILAFLIVLSTSLIFSAMYLGNINTQLTADSITDIEKLATEFDNTFRQFRNTSIYLTQMPDINTFLYSYDTNDYMTLNRADMILRQIRNLTPYLHSIILYNKDTEYSLMSGKTNIEKNQFLQAAMASPDTKSSLNMVLSAVTTDSNSDAPADTLSILFNESNRKSISDDSSIVMTIDREELEKKLLEKFEGATIVLDNNFRVVFSSEQADAGEFMSESAYFERIAASKDPSGSFNARINSTNKIISFTKSMMTDFYLVNILGTDKYTQVIVKNEIIILSISLLILFVFLFAGYLFSRNIYSPIREVADVFSSSKFKDAADSQTEEIATISKVFNNALQHINELELRSTDDNAKLKEEFLRRLLSGNTTDEISSTEVGFYKFNIEFTNLFLCSIRIDNYFMMPLNKKLEYEASLFNIFSDRLSGDFLYEAVNMYEGETALFLNFKNTSENNFNLIIAALDGIREQAKSMLAITLTVGIGGVSNSLGECFDAYAAARDRINHRFILGPDHTIHSRLLENIIHTGASSPDEMMDRAINAIRLNKKEQFVSTLDDIIELLKKFPYSRSVSVLFQLITECIKTINQISQQNSAKYYLGLDDINNIFRSFETLEQAKEWLVGKFDSYQEIIEKISQLKNNKHYSLVENIQNYIKTNYSDQNINVESLADTAGYTSYYFSKIFKEITGLTVIDYIRHVRMTKAKELLAREDIKISEIPNLIGFSNAGYFYNMFKKDVGLTPSAYKEYIQQNKG